MAKRKKGTGGQGPATGGSKTRDVIEGAQTTEAPQAVTPENKGETISVAPKAESNDKKAYVALRAISIGGNTFKKGATAMLTAKQAAQFGRRYVKPK